MSKTKYAHKEVIHSEALKGVQGIGAKLPYSDHIQRCFGKYNISCIQAFLGKSANIACHNIGAEAYTTGLKIAFRRRFPELYTVAHEAAHVIQQQYGVALKGGIGIAGDTYEQQADRVAEAVVLGKSAEHILDECAVASHQQCKIPGSLTVVQCQPLIIQGNQVSVATIINQRDRMLAAVQTAVDQNGYFSPNDWVLLEQHGGWDWAMDELRTLAGDGGNFNYEGTSLAIRDIIRAGGAQFIINRPPAPVLPQNVIANHNLQFDRENASHRFYQGTSIGQQELILISYTQYFYRSMSEEEFAYLNSHNELLINDSYQGIASNYNYAVTYLTNESEAAYLVEFETEYPGYLSEMFSRFGITNKVEGGGTYGVGTTGTHMNKHLVNPDTGFTTGIFFNLLLSSGVIKWRVVRFKVKK